MKRYFVLLALLFFTLHVFSQSNTFIGATIIDAESQVSIPYVSVGFFDKAIGTITNEQGQFKLSYDSGVVEKAPLQISAIGFETMEVPFDQIKGLIGFDVKIELQPIAYDLEEVTISSQKRYLESLGSKAYARVGIGYWHEMEGLGGELATQIDVKHDNTLLHNLTFNIVENLSDSLLVRVNIYDYHKGFPGKNLVRNNIYHTISKKKGVETIPLKEYNIEVDNDIIVSLELVEVYGEVIYFAISSSSYSGNSYTKKISQDRWERQSGTKLGFNLISSYADKSAVSISKSRGFPNKLEIFWDTSFSMKDRNLEEESKLLRKYLRKCDNLTVKVSKFNTEIYETQEFEIRKGKSSDVITYLENSSYYGASSFDDVLKRDVFNANTALLFSDGISRISELSPRGYDYVFSVNSKKQADHVGLQNMAIYNSGAYLDLTKFDTKQGLEFLVKDIENQSNYANVKKDTRDHVYGIVSNEDGPVQGAYVILNNSFEIAETDENGRYIINAKPGDKLTIDAIGMKTKDTIVSALKKLDIPVVLNAEKLAEVELKTKNPNRARAEELVDTPYGKRMRGSVGYSLANRITSDDITPADIDLMRILLKMPGVKVINFPFVPPQQPIYGLTRTMNAGLNGGLPALIIDGLPYDQERGQFAPRINADRIESVTLIPSIVASNRYGSLGAYGLIVVELKNSFNIESTASDNYSPEAIDYTVKGNDYTEQLPTLEEATNAVPKKSYITLLEKSQSFEDAKNNFSALLKTQDSRTVSFQVHTGDYFKKWDKKYAAAIYSTIVELAPNNLKALKTAAYKLDEIEQYAQALSIYKMIVNQFPDKVQSYLDVAKAHINTKEYKTAALLYTQMYFNTIPEVDFTDAAPTIVNELRYLVANHKSQIDYEELPSEMLALDFKKDFRFVFEWNDPLAEFKIQFVDPENKYFTFSHTEFEDSELITSEIKNGLHSKEFEIDDTPSGDWLVNLESFNTFDPQNPVYLKMTVYENFGLPSQQETVNVIALNQSSKKLTLKKLTTNFKN